MPVQPICRTARGTSSARPPRPSDLAALLDELAVVRGVLATIADRLNVEVPVIERAGTVVPVTTLSPNPTQRAGSSSATAQDRVSVVRWSGREACALQR